MPEELTTEVRLARLRELISSARSMPMSASCVVNRSEVLAAIDELASHLPKEIDEARAVIDESQSRIADGEAEAARIIADANKHALQQAGHSAQVKYAEERSAKIIADAEAEAEELRREVDMFIDSRMAGFESVLAKTASQVRTARHRLAERNGVVDEDEDNRPRATELPSLD
jgi:flagellar biosynthesis/type III secretory pathway protein FliH